MDKIEKRVLIVMVIICVAEWALMFVPPYTLRVQIESVVINLISTFTTVMVYRKIKQDIVNRVIRRMESK